MMIKLVPHDLQWKGDPVDAPEDQCAHGSVEFQVNDTVFIKPEDGDLTLSAGALHLLRTLKRNHTRDHPVTCLTVLIPADGYAIYRTNGEFAVDFMGPEYGANAEIVHVDGKIMICSEWGAHEIVSFSEWARAVFGFADLVEDFYRRCAPKVAPLDEQERDAWAAFWAEWEARRHAIYSVG